DYRQEGLPVAAELGAADTGELGEGVEVAGPGGRHGEQGAVVEDHVGWDALGLRKHHALGAQGFEEGLVGRGGSTVAGGGRGVSLGGALGARPDRGAAQFDAALAAQDGPAIGAELEAAMAGDVDHQEAHGDELAQDRAPLYPREVLADAVGAEALVVE